jgi:hypothetical protein
MQFAWTLTLFQVHGFDSSICFVVSNDRTMNRKRCERKILWLVLSYFISFSLKRMRKTTKTSVGM